MQIYGPFVRHSDIDKIQLKMRTFVIQSMISEITFLGNEGKSCGFERGEII
jgi:hypothetical protein